MKKPVLIIIAGPNGSGKTSITSKILQHEWVESCVYINPDNIAKEKFGDWNSKEAVLDAARYSTQIRETCIQKGEGLIFETVLSADDKIDFILKAKKQGYFIRLFFVGTESPTINASRIAQRVMEGGHDVPIAKIGDTEILKSELELQLGYQKAYLMMSYGEDFLTTDNGKEWYRNTD